MMQDRLETPPDLEFAKRLLAAMEERHVTTTALASATGLSYEAVRKWTKGLAKPSREHICNVASELKVSPAWLHFGEGQP